MFFSFHLIVLEPAEGVTEKLEGQRFRATATCCHGEAFSMHADCAWRCSPLYCGAATVTLRTYTGVQYARERVPLDDITKAEGTSEPHLIVPELLHTSYQASCPDNEHRQLDLHSSALGIAMR